MVIQSIGASALGVFKESDLGARTKTTPEVPEDVSGTVVGTGAFSPLGSCAYDTPGNGSMYQIQRDENADPGLSATDFYAKLVGVDSGEEFDVRGLTPCHTQIVVGFETHAFVLDGGARGAKVIYNVNTGLVRWQHGYWAPDSLNWITSESVEIFL